MSALGPGFPFFCKVKTSFASRRQGACLGNPCLQQSGETVLLCMRASAQTCKINVILARLLLTALRVRSDRGGLQKELVSSSPYIRNAPAQRRLMCKPNTRPRKPPEAYLPEHVPYTLWPQDLLTLPGCRSSASFSLATACSLA